MAEPSDHVIIGDLPADFDEEQLKTNFEAYGTIKWCKLFGGKGGGPKSAMIEFGSVEEATWLVENLNGNVPLGLEQEVTVKFKPKSSGGKAGAGAGGGSGGKGEKSARSSPYGMPPSGGGGGGGGGKGGKGAGAGGGGGGGGAGAKGFNQWGVALSTEPSNITDLWKGLLRHKILPGGTWANDEKTVCVSGLPSDTTDYDLLKIFSPFGPIAPGGVRVKLNEDGTAKGSGMVNFLDLASAKKSIDTLNNCMMPDGRFLRLRQFSDQGGAPKGGKGEKGGHIKKWGKKADGGQADDDAAA